MGMYLMRQIGSRGVYAHPVLPDFMVFLNWQELPWFWHGFDQFWFAAAMVVLVPGVLAFVFGWFAFRSRVTGVYLSIITQALTFALMLAFFRNDMGFGGNNGLTDFKDILGFPVQARATRAAVRRLGARARRRLSPLPLRRRPRSSARCSSRSATPKAAPASSATGWSATSSPSSPLGHARRRRRRALRAAGRHHQSERVRAGQLHRGRDLGRGRRARHARRRGARRDPGQCAARPGSRAPCRSSGCSRSAGCSSSSPCSCRRASSAPRRISELAREPDGRRRARSACGSPAE